MIKMQMIMIAQNSVQVCYVDFVDSQYNHHIGKIFHFLEEDHIYKEICFHVRRKGIGSEVGEVTDVSDKWCMAVTESDAFCQQFLGSWYRHGERAFLGIVVLP